MNLNASFISMQRFLWLQIPARPTRIFMYDTGLSKEPAARSFVNVPL